MSAAAEEALRLVHDAPQTAKAMATAAALEARAVKDYASWSAAERALGMATAETDSAEVAERHIRLAVRLAEGSGLPEEAAKARMSHAFVLFRLGRTNQALKETERAAPHLSGGEAARLHVQRGLILQHVGRLPEALEHYRRALPILRAEGDTIAEARLLINRGVLQAYRGAFRSARADLLKAEGLAQALGQALLSAIILENLGWIAAREGDVPEALTQFDAAERQYVAYGAAIGQLLVDRCETLLSVRLVDEARRAAHRACDEFQRGGSQTDLAEARLLLSHAALLDGDPQAAKDAADAAARAFTRQRRPAWAALARYAVLRACLAIDGQEVGAKQARTAARALERTGWALPALDARLTAALLALEAKDVRGARRDLARASAARGRGPAELRARAWHAEALRRLADGDRRGTWSALRTGMRHLEEQQAAVGATDLRASSSAHRSELAYRGLRLSFEESRPERILRWAERCRASHLLHRPVRPPDDQQLAADLGELRAVVAELGRSPEPGRMQVALLRRQEQLERAVRDRCREARGGTAAQARAPTVAQLRATLANHALVEYVMVDDCLSAICLTDRRTSLVHLDAFATNVQRELAHVSFALRRMARGGRNAAIRGAAVDALDHAGARLDHMLLRPLLPAIGDRPLVIVPTGALHDLPWSLLTSCRGRPVTVAPSATIWYATARQAPRNQAAPVALVCGPGLPHAEDEIRALSRLHPGATSILWQQADSAAVLKALEGAPLAHLAAHCHFRTDNPLFSALMLVDGPLTVYDLEGLRSAPDLVVLSACESGRSTIMSGDALLGLAAAFFSLGSRVLVASLVPVSDAATKSLMVALHEALQSGASPAAALSLAQARELDGTGSERAAATAFVCLGAG